MKGIRLTRYWAFQFIGWGLFAVINVFFALLFNRYEPQVLQRGLFFIQMGIIFSHFMRQVILQASVLLKPLRQQIPSLVLLSLVFSFFVTCVVSPYEHLFQLRLTAEGRPLSYLSRFITNFISFIPLMLMWNAIYFMYHFIAKTRKQELDGIKLEGLVRELELQTIRAHINPHFIFNSLNSIRALIEEAPDRARTGITALSNILRSSLTAQRSETVPLHEELKIVADYLALESMRFEDRLQVAYHIDQETLTQTVPPMMLQTLVENAIKHGISKRVQGGVVHITSVLTANGHELVVQNTGRLQPVGSATGFGLASTRDRLALVYGANASFELTELPGELVEARVRLPATTAVKPAPTANKNHQPQRI